MSPADSPDGPWPADMRAQGAHDRRTFGACPVQMLEANVDPLDRTPSGHAGALADCSAECQARHRCLRRRG